MVAVSGSFPPLSPEPLRGGADVAGLRTTDVLRFRLHMPKRTIVTASVDELRPHPARSLVPPLTPEEFQGLKADISRRGVQVPLCVTPQNVVLCGHHRLRAAEELKIPGVPVMVIPGLTPAEEISHLVLDNVHRRQLTPSQKAAMIASPKVAKALLEVLRRDGRRRQLEAGAQGKEGGRGHRKTHEEALPQGFRHERALQTRDRLGKIAGVSGRMIDLALYAWKHSPERMQLIQAGASDETVSHVAYGIRRAAKATEAERAVEMGVVEFEKLFKLQRFDVWAFAGLDPGFGQTWPGNIPASLVANVLYYFTDAGDLVIDPMAGGGVTGDVCRALRRTSILADINPSRPEIIRHRIEDGPLPKTKGRAALVFLDPPYWSLKAEDYAADSSSSLSWMDWTIWLRRMATSAALMAKPGGYVCTLMQDSLTKGVERFQPGRSSIFETLLAMKEAGLECVTTIACPLTTQQAAKHAMEWGKRNRRLLGIHRILIVFRKGKPV